MGKTNDCGKRESPVSFSSEKQKRFLLTWRKVEADNGPNGQRIIIIKIPITNPFDKELDNFKYRSPITILKSM